MVLEKFQKWQLTKFGQDNFRFTQLSFKTSDWFSNGLFSRVFSKIQKFERNKSQKLSKTQSSFFVTLAHFFDLALELFLHILQDKFHLRVYHFCCLFLKIKFLLLCPEQWKTSLWKGISNNLRNFCFEPFKGKMLNSF